LIRRRSRSAGALIICILLIGCTSRHPNEPSPSTQPRIVSTDLRLVVDTPPYWCDFVPQEALDRVTGSNRSALKEQRSGWQSDHGTCLVGSGKSTSELGLSWDTKNGAKTVARMEGIYKQQFGPVRLPVALGYGFTVKTAEANGERPYYVIATFRCGSIQPWLRIDLLNISSGRDPTKDLTDLMRIAEQRFGKLHHCTPTPT
jgi:hypothetical protein